MAGDYTSADMRVEASINKWQEGYASEMLLQGADAVDALEERRLHDKVMLATLCLDPDTCTWKDVQPAVAMLLHRHDKIAKALAEYEAAAQFPGDDQRHRGASTAMQLVHCQHKREQAEAEIARLTAHNARLEQVIEDRMRFSVEALESLGRERAKVRELREALQQIKEMVEAHPHHRRGAAMSDYTPAQMRAAARHIDVTAGEMEGDMLRQGADAVDALAAKDTEIARLTEELSAEKMRGRLLSNCSESAESALAAERAKVRKLREWIVARRTDHTLIDLMRMAYGRIIEKMDELSLTGEEP